MKAFEEALQTRFEGYEDFLRLFKSRGFYLEDLLKTYSTNGVGRHMKLQSVK